MARPVAATATRSLASASAGHQLAAMTKENPHIDVVRYEHKNKKWSLNHCDYFSEAVAIGLLETGLQPGDTLLCWLPLHFQETVSIGEGGWSSLVLLFV